MTLNYLPLKWSSLLGIEGMKRPVIESLLDRANQFADLPKVGFDPFKGKTVFNPISKFNRTRVHLIWQRAKLVHLWLMPVSTSSIKKGESLLDTATTLNAAS